MQDETTPVAEETLPPWSNMPVAPDGYTWVRKDRFAQTRTRNYYPVAEVVSALEKSILRGDFQDASFWFYEYVTLGPQFVSSTWAFLFQFGAASISTANPHLLSSIWTEYGKYKAFLSLAGAQDATVDEELDSRCLAIMAGVVRTLCESPKTRIVDSAIRTFLLPFPSTTYVRPYEPHRSLDHVRHADTDDVPCSSYVDVFEDQPRNPEPRYSLFQLEEDDPPYLYSWCNAMVQSVESFIVNKGSEQSLSAVLYYAGLIYQCSEPCHTRVRRQDSVMILWQIIGTFKARLSESAAKVVHAYRQAGDEFSKNSHKRERYFVIGALLVLLRELLGESAAPPTVDHAVDIAGFTHMTKLPVPDDAVDYSTRQGVAIGATVEQYVRVTSALCEAHDCYLDMALLYEKLRVVEQIKDPRRKIASMIPFFRFQVRTTDDTDKKKSKATTVKLRDIYTLPRWWFTQDAPCELPWRGQFVPFEPDANFSNCSAAPYTVLADVSCMGGGTQYNNGLFFGILNMPNFVSVDVVFVPCASAKHAFNQCLVDELKPLFGVPAMGTHCFYLDATLQKKNKKEDWSDENMEWSLEAGAFYVCYRASSFGFITGDTERALSTASVLVTETHANQAGNLGKQVVVSSTQHVAVRNQLTNIYLFYACVGAPGGPLSRVLVRAADGRPLDTAKLLNGDVDEHAALATSRLVPFYELQAFANVRFPTTFKPLKTVLMRKLLMDDQDHFKQRYLDVMQHLDVTNLEWVLQTFGVPVVEWSTAIRDNLRDLRSAWLLWSKAFESAHLEQVRKRVEKNRQRALEKKAAKKSPAPKATKRIIQDDDDGVDDVAPLKKKLPPAKKLLAPPSKKMVPPPAQKVKVEVK